MTILLIGYLNTGAFRVAANRTIPPASREEQEGVGERVNKRVSKRVSKRVNKRESE